MPAARVFFESELAVASFQKFAITVQNTMF